jgi:hypothetical protein
MDPAVDLPKIGTGPDLNRCGQRVEWNDRANLDEQFIDAARKAVAEPEYEIELARWMPDDSLAQQYVSWWNNQRSLLRRWLHVELAGTGLTYVVHRRVDQGDGIMKCYVRIEPGETT